MKEKDYLKEIADFGGLTGALSLDWGARIAYGEPFNESLSEMKHAIETYCIYNNYPQNLKEEVMLEFIKEIIEYSNK
jgi:hypothetical protein